MLEAAIVFLIMAIAAGIFAFIGFIPFAMGIAKIIFFIFLALFVMTLITGRRKRI